MGKQIIQKDKNIIATFKNTEVYNQHKSEIPPHTLCLIEEKQIDTATSIHLFDGSSLNGGKGAWKEPINLSQEFTNFDKLIVQFNDEGANDIYVEVMDTLFLYARMGLAIQTNKQFIFAGKGSRYVNLKPSSTTTILYPNWTNIYIRNIWGWKA